jgi:succinate dehydrogenase / fumarate reductase flavoprotein subunit
MGGIDVDTRGASCLAGFFAAGECACVSVHGANRLGGNSLLDTVVFGKIAGEEASEFVKGLDREPSGERPLQEGAQRLKEKIGALQKKDSGIKTHHFLNRLKLIMSEKVGIFRTQKDLAEALDGIRQVREDYKDVYISSSNLRFCQEAVNILEFEFMLDLAEVITLGALNREETRGSHYRLDFPEREDKNWLKHTMVTFKDGRPEIGYKEVKLGKYKPQARVY